MVAQNPHKKRKRPLLPIRQQGQTYVHYHLGVEGFVGLIAHHPRTIRGWEKKLRNGTYWRITKGVSSLASRIAGFRFSDYHWYFVGVSHLDAAWLWPVVDTKVRAFKTFCQAIENTQRFPFFTVSLTSPQYYQWIKEYAPQLWARVKAAVAAGRIEPVGGSWVEPDLDMPWGESLVRQRLYGQLFYLREFGQLPVVEALLDVFGFAYSIPQILVKSGAQAFWTTKCFWNDTNPWPVSNFVWQGVDGSRLFTYEFQYNWTGFFDIKKYRQTARLPLLEKGGTILSSQNTNAEIQACLSNERVRDFGFFYGWGDGGKGPDRIEVGATQLLAQLGYGKHTNIARFFAHMQRVICPRVLVWNDEMYLEYHRGTKTSVKDRKSVV